MGGTQHRPMTASLAPSAPVRDSSYRTSEILSALSCALDITEGQPPGHAVRTCLIGMRLARSGRLSRWRTAGSLFYALLLKDLGCSSNAARLCSLFGADDRELKREHKLTDWSRSEPSLAYALRNAVPEASPMGRVLRVAVDGGQGEGQRAGDDSDPLRPRRGDRRHARLHRGDARGDPHAGRALGRPRDAARACRAPRFRCWDESSAWRSRSRCSPARLRGGRGGRRSRWSGAGRWFDPALVDALESLAGDDEFWAPGAGPLTGAAPRARSSRRIRSSSRTTRGWTSSRGVRAGHRREVTVHLPALRAGGRAGGDDRPTAALQRGAELRDLRRAGLLHDIGKLGVSHADPGQARPADRARARRGAGASGVHPADPRAGGGVLRDRARSPARTTSGWTERATTSACRASGCRR